MSNAPTTMSTASLPETPFARALRQWKAELKRSDDKESPFYKQVLAAENNLSTGNGQEECARCARQLSGYIQQLETAKRDKSKFVRLCSKLEPFVDSITRWMKICSTVVQAAPFEVAIVFAGAQLLLQLAANQATAFDKMVDIMTEIARNLRCYDKFSAAYETSDEVCELLVDAYCTIIGFWHRASQVLSLGSFRSVLTNLLKPIDAEWKTCLERLQKNSQAVLALAQATNAFESRQSQKLDLTKDIAKWIIAGEDASKLLFRSDLNASQSIREDGTCNWIFEQPNFKSWYEAKKNTVAWYHAPPGSGKTILSAAVADNIEQGGGQVVYYRFSFDDITRKTPLAALRSIAIQLRTIMGKIPPQLVELYNKELNHHAYQLHDQDIAIQVVHALMEQMPRVHIIVDGLDECNDIDSVLAMFTRLAQSDTYGIVKWFFTSRDDSTIRNIILNKLKAAELTPPRGKIMDDITVFLDSHGRDKLARNDCAECVKYWTAASEENFLYSKLMFEILCGDGVTCSDEIHEELLKFPPGLTGCYTRCLESITRKRETERNLARRIFLFLVYAEKPLTVKELSHALAIVVGAEYDDHQQGRVPTLETIKSLGGSLIRLEESPTRNESDSMIKFVHKSVLDFFRENPTRLGIPSDRLDLRSFFIDDKEGNLELGRHCLKYLQFKRYQRKVDISAVLANSDEHAFLTYSAAFWFEHLNRADHSEDLFCEVKSFIHSLAFWTCLMVQVQVRPHLFARYTQTAEGEFSLGLERGELSKDAEIMVPLPDWLELYKPDGHDISQAFYVFLREWHEVLVLHPEAGSNCQMDQTGKHFLPGIASSMSKNTRISTISAPARASSVALASVQFEKSKPIARLTYLEDNTTRWQEGPIAANEPPKSGTIQMPGNLGTTKRLIRCGATSHHSSPVLLSISLQDLEVEHCHDSKDASRAPKSCHIPVKQKDHARGWNLITESSYATNHGSAMTFHLTSSRFEEMRKQEVDSGYDSASGKDSDSESDSWSESDDDSGDVANDDDDSSSDKEREHFASDCLIIYSEGKMPRWIPWTEESGKRMQVSCAFHPTRRIAAFTRGPGELEIIDLANGEISNHAMEEPELVRTNVSASVICREMRFSSCGQYLYCVLVMIADSGDIESTCDVSLSTFRVEDFSGNTSIRPHGPVQRLMYKFGATTDRLRAPYILSYWDTESLFLCLPLLSCNPKMVRLRLTKPDELEKEATVIKTLTNPIYFPNSTPCRSPRILYRSSHNSDKKDIFVLALDSLCQDQANDEESNNGYSPMVMEWKIDGKAGWRAWDQAVDGEEARLAEERRTYAQLRGSFIDADRRFNIVVRSGLNWTKKAFLSCA